jgi:5'-3' exonuclease
LTPSADIVAYSCAAYNDPWGWDACRKDIDELMRRILETTGADTYEAFISGADNFRYGINPDYKANRKGKIDPQYRADANAYLVTEFHARVTDGYEADDALGIAATSLGDGEFVVCSIDKDLMQIPGQHYNWRRNEFTTVSPIDGLRSFYRQLLIGDTSDNIVGVSGIGTVKAGRIINDLDTEEDMFLAVQTMYNDDTRLLMNGQCMWLWRQDNDLWRFPNITTTITDEEEFSPVQE